MSEQRLFRIAEGRSLPEDWEFVEWIGTENNIVYGPPNYRADIVLAKRARAQGSEDASPTSEVTTSVS